MKLTIPWKEKLLLWERETSWSWYVNVHRTNSHYKALSRAMQVGDSRTVKEKGKLNDEMKNHACFLISLFGSSINLFLWLSRWITNFPSVVIDAFVLIRTSWNLVQNLGLLENHVLCLSYMRQSKETCSYVFSHVKYLLLSCTILIQLSVCIFNVYEHMCIIVITCWLGCLKMGV